MSTNKKMDHRLWLTIHLGTIIFIMACTVFGTAQQTGDDLFHFDDGNIEIQNENGDWVQVEGTSFELVGELDGTDPWAVTGQEFETRDTTMIDDNLEVGDLVRVRGVILEDGTWVAYSIEGTDEQTDPIIVLIGVVDSMDPWSVNEISLNVTDETDIQGEIVVGTVVRVEILLLEDGTWEVISIAPLGESTETSGCVTVIATVVSVSEGEIQFLGWPITVTLDGGDQNDETNSEITIAAGDVVQAVICVSDDGTLIIVQITSLNTDEESDNETPNGEKVLVCHKPDKKGGHTLSIASSAVPAHLAHGDTLGACP